MNKRKLIAIVGVIVSIIVAVAAVLFFTKKPSTVMNTGMADLDAETRRAMTYTEITDASVDGCDSVEFSAFFTRDLDGDGYAEKYDGSCNYIDKKATLYFDINVLPGGSLENGVITINGTNFNLQTTLVRDGIIANDYISNDTRRIEFETLNAATQKLFSGNIVANIGNNINNYSANNSTIVFTADWVPSDGSPRQSISKTITLKTDWYGKTSTRLYPYYIETAHDIEEAIGDDVTLSFDVGYEETAEELILQKQRTEITIPDINGVAALDATVTSQNCSYVNFNPETKTLVIERSAEVSETGSVTKSISRLNLYTVQVKYPLKAWEELGSDTISLTFPTIGYYYGFNNSSDEFMAENPYISSAQRSWTHRWMNRRGDTAAFDVYVGRYVYYTEDRNYKYLVSKELPLNMYNNIGQEEGVTDDYIVRWVANVGKTYDTQEGLYIEETKGDTFKDSSGTDIDMTPYVSTKGIYFANVDGCLSEDGWIKVYDATTNEELVTFTNGEWNNYSSENPYYFDAKSIKIKTSRVNDQSYLTIYQIKEIDDEALTTAYEIEQFNRFDYVYSYVKGGLINNGEEGAINQDSNYAYYEAPVTEANVSVTPYAISNQEQKDIEIEINTENIRYNEREWKNGQFVFELPEEVLDVVLNDVSCNNSRVEIVSPEVYEENGKRYIRVYTKNDTAEKYKLTISASLTADPRCGTTNTPIKMYAINNGCRNYRERSRTKDTLDINKNGNTEEFVLYKQLPFSIVAPSSLLTAQTLSNFDDAGTEVVSPQIAIIDKAANSRDAKVNVTITNNYTSTISETLIVGKIPFEGNTYQISKKDLGSKYTVAMKNTGITLPNEVAGVAKVYYSTNTEATEDLKDASNNWKTADQITDWSQVRTYAIDLSGYVLRNKESLTFSYDIEVPPNINYNDVTFSAHAVYFCLDTQDGKIKTRTEVSKLGIMIARKFNLSLTKYKSGTDKKVQGAVYRVSDGTTSRAGITDNNGLATVNGLYVEKEYTVKEIQTPDDYVLNENEVKFRVVVDADGNLQIEEIDGTIRGQATITNVDGMFTLNFGVEDIARYDVDMIKRDVATNEVLKGVKFKLTGGMYGTSGRIFTTASNGELLMTGLVPDTEYTLQETKADGYYVRQDPITFTLTRNVAGNLIMNSSDASFANANIVETIDVDKATVNVQFTNEAIPTYSLNIDKKNNKNEVLAGTQFKLTSIDTNESTYLTTDEQGKINLNGLYRFVQGKYITGEYILQEVKATEGYITDTTEIRFKAQLVGDNLNIIILEGNEAINASNSDGTSITFEFINEPIFKLVKKGDEDKLLPGAKFVITDLAGNSVTDIKGNPIGKLEGIPAEKLTFTSNPDTSSIANTPWTKRDDGVWESGSKNVNNGVSPLTSNEFTINQTRTLSFEWAASTESINYDYLYYTITNLDTGVIIGGNATGSKIGGNNTITDYNNLIFEKVEKELQPGTYTIEFIYRKDGSVNNGLDSGFVKNVQIDGDGQYLLTTDENGEFTADLPEGMYKVIEVVAPEGYELPENEEDRTYYVGIGVSKDAVTEFQMVWAKQMTGSGHSDIRDLKPTSDGGYIIAGSFTGECDLDADGVTDITAVGNSDSLIVKFDKDGKYEWHYTYGLSGADEFNAISIAPDGYIAAGYEYTAQVEDATLVKIDNSGNLVWKKFFAGDYKDEIRDVEVLSDGRILAVGRFYSPAIDFGSGYAFTNDTNYYHGFIACFNANGTTSWAKHLSANNNVNVTAVTETNQGIAVAVDYLGTIDLGGTSITSAGNQDSVVVGYSTSGTYQWKQELRGANNESIIALTTDSDNNIVAVGGFASELTLGTETVTPQANDYSNAIMLRISPFGEYVANSVYTFGGTGNDDKLTSVMKTSDGGLILGGWSYCKDYDTNGDGVNDVTNKGCNDGIAIKMNENGTVEWTKLIQGATYDPVYGVAELTDGKLLIAGNFDSASISIDNKTNALTCQGYTDAYMVTFGNVETEPEVPQRQEVEAKNELIKLKITSEIAENSDGERAGGTITGTPTKEQNINLVEEVKYGYDETNQIIIAPETNYSVYSVEIDGESVSFVPDENGVVNIPLYKEVIEDHHVVVIFEKNVSRIEVHHYLKDRDGNKTDTKLAEDEYYTGKIGEAYTTSPRDDIEGYQLIGGADYPKNSAGTYTAEKQDINYYYEELPVKLTVHHYEVGTETKLVSDREETIYKGEEYTTAPDDTLLDRYDVFTELTTVRPEGAETSGIITEDTVVTYYYRLKRYNILTKIDPTIYTKLNELTNEKEEVTVEGGTISGKDKVPYEVVKHGDDTTQEIVVKPYPGYRIDRITINGTEIEFTPDENGEYRLDTITNVTEDKTIIAKFAPISGTVIVHHYVKGINTPVKLQDGTFAEDQTKQGYVGDLYATKAKENLAEGYVYDSVVGETSGKYVDGTIEVTYYYEALVDIDIVKKWNHTNNIYGKPESLIVELHANGEKIKEATMTEANKVTIEDEKESEETWKYTFRGLSKYDDDGNEIDYTVSEQK